MHALSPKHFAVQVRPLRQSGSSLRHALAWREHLSTRHVWSTRDESNPLPPYLADSSFSAFAGWAYGERRMEVEIVAVTAIVEKSFVIFLWLLFVKIPRLRLNLLEVSVPLSSLLFLLSWLWLLLLLLESKRLRSSLLLTADTVRVRVVDVHGIDVDVDVDGAKACTCMEEVQVEAAVMRHRVVAAMAALVLRFLWMLTCTRFAFALCCLRL